MTIEERIRQEFDRSADDLPVPDLDVVLAGGRKRRRNRIATLTTGSVVAAALAVGVVPLVHAQQGTSPAPAAGSTTAATTSGSNDDQSANPVARRLVAAVASAVPSLPAPDKVYPSDWNRTTALPPSDAANATEWQLHYELPNGEELLVYTTIRIPGMPPVTCDAFGSDCRSTTVPGGRVVQLTQHLADRKTGAAVNTQFLETFQATDGRVVNVIETLPQADAKVAAQHRSLSGAQLSEIAVSDGLVVPGPQVTPPPPTGR